MKANLRIIAMLLASLLLILSLASCIGNPPSETQGNDPTDAPTEKPTDTPTNNGGSANKPDDPDDPDDPDGP